jgi:MFS family permease
MTRLAGDFEWRRVMASALIPALLYSTGVGAILPAIPLIVSRLGEPLFADTSTALAVTGIVTALLMIGELVGNLPGGWLVSRLGERNSMLGAAYLSIVGIVVCMVSRAPGGVGVGVFLIGLATAVFGLARHAFITTYVPVAYRARVLATVGGLFRFGYFVGPFLTVAVLTLFGALESAYWIHLAMCVASIAVLLFTRDPERVMQARDRASGEHAAPARRRSGGLAHTIATRRDVLLRLGVGAAVISALRAGRIVVLPLWAVSIGLDEVTTATIVGVAGGVDFALFYVGGWLIDRYGRMWNALPSTLGLAVSLVALAFTHDLPHAVTWFVALALVMSIANGLGTGILLTLGADLADPHDPAPFLGAWRFTGSLGNAGAPVALAVLTAAVSLPFAAGALGAVGIVGAVILARYIPRFIPGESLRLSRRGSQGR